MPDPTIRSARRCLAVPEGAARLRPRGVAPDEGLSLTHGCEGALRFGALVVGEDGRVGPIGVRRAHDATEPRTHVSAFVREIVVSAAHVVLPLYPLPASPRPISSSKPSTRSSPSSLSSAR